MAKKSGLPGWYRIVTEFGFPNGPTVPFLLGAVVVRPLNVAPKDAVVAQRALYELLQTMNNSGYRVLVRDCPSTDAFVVVSNAGYGTKSLEWQADLNVTTVDALFGKLWTKHSVEICAGRFSRNRTTDEWEPFSDAELARIREFTEQ